ncbi:MAG: hypothetical protein WCP79_08280 [Bacillota bacterium]
MADKRLSLDDLDRVDGGAVSVQYYGSKQGITGFKVTAPTGGADEDASISKDFDRIYGAIDTVAGNRGIVDFYDPRYAQFCDESMATLQKSVNSSTSDADKAYGAKLLDYARDRLPSV